MPNNTCLIVFELVDSRKLVLLFNCYFHQVFYISPQYMLTKDLCVLLHVRKFIKCTHCYLLFF